VRHTVKCRKNEVSLNPAIVMNRADLLGVRNVNVSLRPGIRIFLNKIMETN
jgi:hypothetical protein